jgi:AhpD family alkylhydroperoxidase
LRLLDRILYFKVAPRQIRYLKSIDYAHTAGLARDVMEQMDADFVVGPPLTVHLPNPELLAGVWSLCRECLAAGHGTRQVGDLVAGVISRLNSCPYCFVIHTSMLHSFDAPELAEALQQGREVANVEMQRVANWAAATLNPDAAILRTPPFPRAAAPLVIGTAICFHYLNRMVNVFLDPLPLSGAGWIGGPISRMSGRIMRARLSQQQVVPGRFLNEAPDVPLPNGFHWAEPDRNISAGVRRFVAAAEEAGRESVDPRVRERVRETIVAWRGENPGIGRGWVEKEVAQLDEGRRPAARLALLTAMASYQVDEGIVEPFRRQYPRDRDLINLTSWASYTAVCRIASWC